MREVVFYHVGPVHPFVLKMIQSVRDCMDLPITQFTDMQTDAIKYVDHVIRKDYRVGLSADRIYHMRDYEHDELIMLDNDLLVKQCVEHVFDNEFDVALTLRSNSEPGGVAKINQGQPYNTGVVFSRSNDFWVRCADWVDQADEECKKWGAEQRSINDIALAPDEGFDVYTLQCDEYNWSPNSHDMENERAHIWHFKGDRKRWM